MKLGEIPSAFSSAIQNNNSNGVNPASGPPASSESNANTLGSKTGGSNSCINESTTSRSSLNSIYGDLSSIVAHFGKFKPFLRFNEVTIDGQMFVSTLERYLVTRYGSADDIIEHFYVFLSEELYSWFFNLGSTEKANWTDFKKSFIEKASDLEYELYELSALKKDEFLAKLKVLKPDDSKLASNIVTYPISTYFSEKLRTLSLVHPKMSSGEMILNIFSHLGDKKVFMKLFKYRKDSDALAFMAKSEDKLNNNNNS